MRGLPRRRGVFSAVSLPGAGTAFGPFASGAGGCGVGPAAGLLRFFGGPPSSSRSCVMISAPPMVEGIEDAAGCWCCNTGC